MRRTHLGLYLVPAAAVALLVPALLAPTAHAASTRRAVAAGTTFAAGTTVAAGTTLAAGTTVAAWSFNQPSGGVVTDTTGRGHDAQADPTAPFFSFSLDPVLGRYVGLFEHDDGRVLIPASADLSPGSADFSIGITIKTVDDNGNTFQAGTTKPNQDFVKFEVADIYQHAISGIPRCHFTGDASLAVGGYLILGPQPINDGRWHTIRCQKTANAIAMWVDGVVVNVRKVVIGTVDLSGSEWSIGGKYMPNMVTAPWDMFTGTVRDAYITHK